MFLSRICCHPQWHHHKLQGAEEVPGKQYFNDLLESLPCHPFYFIDWIVKSGTRTNALKSCLVTG